VQALENDFFVTFDENAGSVRLWNGAVALVHAALTEFFTYQEEVKAKTATDGEEEVGDVAAADDEDDDYEYFE
jgi:hypothetical protein